MFIYEVDASLLVTRIFMILSLGNTLAGTLFAFYGAIKEEAVKTSLNVGGHFIGAGEYVNHSALQAFLYQELLKIISLKLIGKLHWEK